MIELYYRPGAASFPVHAALEESGAEYRLIRVSGSRDTAIEPRELLELNPAGRVPTMRIDGMVLTESVACLMHLSDLFPEARLAPPPGTPERAQWYRWLAFLTNTVQASFLNYLRPERAIAPEHTGLLEQKATEVLAVLRADVDAHLGASGPYLLGKQFSSADLFLAMLTRWGRRLEPKWWDAPHLGAHWRAIRERPSLQAVYEQEGLEE
jgi:glutathione S-transferase